MIDKCRSLLFLLITATFIPQASAQRTGKRWLDMDYGPYLTASIESSLPQRNIAQKGIAIKLGKEKYSYVIFDTDLLRYSVGWKGAFLNFRGVAFDGSHGTWPSVAGQQIFGTIDRPGWAKNGGFADPRTSYQGKGYGPLPHEHSRYKGLYLHGQQVILSYQVGGAPMLDSPGWHSKSGNGIFTRTLQIGKSEKDLLLSVIDTTGELSLISKKELKTTGTNKAIEGNAILLDDIKRVLSAKNEKEEKGPSKKGLVAHWPFDEEKGQTARSSNGKYPVQIKGGWTSGKIGSALSIGKGHQAVVNESNGLNMGQDFSITAWIKTRRGGTILSKTVEGEWVRNGKTFFVRGGRLAFDIGWVGVVQSPDRVNDGKWHHVALIYRASQGRAQLFIDGKPSGAGTLRSVPDPKVSKVRFGYTSKDFPEKGNRSFEGAIDDVRFYQRALTAREMGVDAPALLTMIGAQASKKSLTWGIADGQVRIAIPASATPLSLQIAIGTTEKKPSRQTLTDLAESLAADKIQDLKALTKGGKPRWEQKLKTNGKIGASNSAYVADTLTPPRDNPWRAWMRFGGFDFFKNGTRAAICTWSGDVWLVDGIEDLKELTWKRIATGMYQPLGLKIIERDGKEEIFVCCRDQITRLHDLNGDEEIDFYESFNNDHQVTEHFHEFAMDLQTDAEGNFYYAKSARHAKTPIVPHHGTLIKVSADGKKTEIICNGFRAANGAGIGPNGELMTSDQEGHWTPANRINMVKKGGFYGNLWSYHGGKRTPEDGYEPPLCWLPKNVDRSPAEQLWVTSDKWGPLKGKMLHTSYGTGQLFLLMHEKVNGIPQGGVVPFPGLRFPTGIMRGRFHKQSGQLYVCGLVGWSSNCALPGDFYRIRYTGKKVHMPVDIQIKANGIALTFTEPLDKATAEDVDSYAIEQWNYRWTRNYGSKHYKVSNPKRTGQDEVDVENATLSEDGKTVFLEIEDVQPVMQMKIQLDLKAKDGTGIRHVIHNTINKVGKK